MTGQDLKNSILQLAIQGKLVAQDANDEPASVLLERIKAEKKKLIEEKKIKKEKPLAEITEDEKPFEIPNSWVWCRMRDILDVRDGTHDSPKYHSKGFPLVTSKNLKKNTIDFSTALLISEEDYINISQRSAVDNEDILFAMIGSIGNPVLVKKDREFAIKNMALFKKSQYGISMKYVFWFLECQQYAMREYASGGVQSFVSLKYLREYLIPLPPLSEQKRIVAKIEELMPLVEEYDKAQKELDALNSGMPEQLKQSILQEAIMGKLGTNNPDDEPASELLKRIRKEKEQLIKDKKIKKEKPLQEITDEEKPFDIPDNWVWCRMRDILDVRDGTHDSPKYHSKGFPLVTSKNLKNNTIDFSTALLISEEDYINISQRSAVDNEDILFAMIGSIGNPVLVKKDRDFAIKNMALFKKSQNGISMKYVFWFLECQQYAMREYASGGVQSFVSLKYLREYLIPLPPLAEQHRIVSKIENLFACIEPLAKDLK